jgi:hypothetical protein
MKQNLLWNAKATFFKNLTENFRVISHQTLSSDWQIQSVTSPSISLRSISILKIPVSWVGLLRSSIQVYWSFGRTCCLHPHVRLFYSEDWGRTFPRNSSKILPLYITYQRTAVFSQLTWLKLYRPSDNRLSANLVLTFADRGTCVVSATDSHGR